MEFSASKESADIIYRMLRISLLAGQA